MARKRSNKAALAALQAALHSQFEDASDHADTFMAPLRQRAMEYYAGKPFGDEEDGRSQWISTELRDVTQVCLTNLQRVFCSKTNRIFSLVPRTPKDVPQAEAQADYLNYLIDIENDGFSLMSALLRDSLVIPGGGIAHWRYEPVDEIEYENYTGLDPAQAAFLRSDPEVDILDEKIEVHFETDDHGLEPHHLDHLDDLAQAGMPLPAPGAMLPQNPEAMPDPRAMAEAAASTDGEPAQAIAALMPAGAEICIDLRLRRTKMGGRIRCDALPPECFIIERRARDLDSAAYVARREIRTVSDLVELGYDFDEVMEHAGADDTSVTRGGMEEFTRNHAVFFQTDADATDDAARKVLFCEHFIRFDLDGDNKSELLRVVTVGSDCHMLADPEPVSEIPFAQFCIDPTPHTALQTASFFELVEDIQRGKSQIMRDVFDNLASAIAPRMAIVEGQVNINDALSTEPNGIIRQKAPGMITPLAVPFVGEAALGIIQYLDDTRAQRTGISRNSQGLDADALQSTSALAVSQMTEAASARMEQIARTLAETGFRRMARGMLRLVRRRQNKPTMLKLREQWVEIDPRGWTSDLDVTVSAGVGRGDDAKRMALLQQVFGLQSSLLQQLGPNNPIVSLVNYRNTLSDMAIAGGLIDSSRYFREITPEIEQAIAQQQQAKQQQPLDQVSAFMQVENTKAQLAAENAKLKLALDAMKAAAEDDRERDKMASATAVKAAEIAARWHGQVNEAALSAEIERDRMNMQGAVDFATHLTTPQAPPGGAPISPEGQP